jgi:Flp pilus assembly protein TadD
VWLDIAETRNDRIALSKALEALGRASSSPEAGSDVLTLYGRALLQDGQIQPAEQALQPATTRYPIEPAALLWYATVAGRQNPGPARAALVHYEGLALQDQQFVLHASQIAALSLRLDDPPTAVDWLRRAVDAEPPDSSLLASLADAELKAADRDAARSTLARALEKDPNNPALVSLARRVR